MAKNSYNIEFAHVYADENFNKEHQQGVELLLEVKKNIPQHATYVTAVLVDEYNPDQKILDIKEYVSILAKMGAMPDFLGFESELALANDEMMKSVDSKIRKEYERYFANKQKIACSFLVAIWNLMRLGLLDLPNAIVIKQKPGIADFVGERLITILPERYRENEERALRVIKHSQFAPAVEKIQYVYF